MAAPTIYYDGPCHVCQRAVLWVRRAVPGVACIPLQSDDARRALPVNLTTPPLLGVVVVDGEGRIHVGHRGLHALAPHARGFWSWLLRWTPAWGYRLVARCRGWGGRDTGCAV